MKKIILTGGGTAGHVTPNLALVPLLKEAGYDILYVGSKEGIEKGIVEELGIPYEGISTGKLRRYLSVQNLTDPARTLHGFREARKIIRDYKPDVIFSKGGFVSVPVVAAAKTCKVPVITHESDLTIGLANKINMRSASLLCCNFPETAKGIKPEKVVVTGCPIRPELFAGTKEEGRAITGFNEEKPVLMVTGGSLGSVAVNNAVRGALPKLLEKFQVLHLCGKGNLDAELEGTSGYVQYEYVSSGMKDLFALADIVISRAGANAICELVALRKPNLLIPLPSSQSRGDQLLNAESFKKLGFSKVLLQEDVTEESLISNVNELYESRDSYIKKMAESDHSDSAKIIFDLIEKYRLEK